MRSSICASPSLPLSYEDLRAEQEKLLEAIAEYRKILGSEEEKSKVIKRELRKLARDFRDDRRTHILESEANDIDIEDTIAQEDMAITITRDGTSSACRWTPTECSAAAGVGSSP